MKQYRCTRCDKIFYLNWKYKRNPRPICDKCKKPKTTNKNKKIVQHANKLEELGKRIRLEEYNKKW